MTLDDTMMFDKVINKPLQLLAFFRYLHLNSFEQKTFRKLRLDIFFDIYEQIKFMTFNLIRFTMLPFVFLI